MPAQGMAMSVLHAGGKAAGDAGAHPGKKRGWSSMDGGGRLGRHEDGGVGVDGRRGEMFSRLRRRMVAGKQLGVQGRGKVRCGCRRGQGHGVHAAQRQRLRNQTGPQAPATLLLAPRHRIIKIRKQGVVVPGYDTVDGAGLGAFAGMLPADQCAQRAMCAFEIFSACAHHQGRDDLQGMRLPPAGGS